MGRGGRQCAQTRPLIRPACAVSAEDAQEIIAVHRMNVRAIPRTFAHGSRRIPVFYKPKIRIVVSGALLSKFKSIATITILTDARDVGFSIDAKDASLDFDDIPGCRICLFEVSCCEAA